MSRIKANVEWFDLNKGFGVAKDDSGKTYRFRWRDILQGRLFKGVKENDVVELEPAVDRSGRDVANDVVLVSKAQYTPRSSSRLSDSYDSDDEKYEVDVDYDHKDMEYDA